MHFEFSQIVTFWNIRSKSSISPLVSFVTRNWLKITQINSLFKLNINQQHAVRKTRQIFLICQLANFKIRNWFRITCIKTMIHFLSLIDKSWRYALHVGFNINWVYISGRSNMKRQEDKYLSSCLFMLDLPEIYTQLMLNPTLNSCLSNLKSET